MKNFVLTGIVACSVLLSGISFSEETARETVKVVLNDAGYAPFHTPPAESGGEVTAGIVVELLQEFQNAYPKYDIQIIGIPKIREQMALDKGAADMTYNSPTFIGERAQQFLWSEAFAASQDVVVMLKTRQFPFEKPEDLFGKTVGKIRGFGYGEYDAYFESGKIIGNDVTEPGQLFKMLKAGRLDCFFGNTYVTPYEMRLAQEDREAFYFSEKALYEFQLMFQIIPQKPTLKADLDAFIISAKASGLLQKIERHYK